MSVQEKDRVITCKGYAIKKSFLTPTQLKHLQSELTVAPKVLDKFQRGVESFPIYHESKTRFYVPRYWGKKTFGEPEANIVSEGLALPDTITDRKSVV